MSRVNVRTLKRKRGKDYAELIFFGDLHLGHPTCLKSEKAQEYIDYAKENGSYILLMGDLIECGLTNSVGDSVYTQKLNPQEQMEEIVNFLSPVKDQIIGSLEGNHCARVFKTSGINVGKIIAKDLGVPFLGMACWNVIKVGRQTYTIYALHGASGSRFIYTKLKAATDISHYFSADVIAHAHVHDLASHTIERQTIKDNEIVYTKTHILLTGHYLGYDESYAQAKGMPPSKIGSPTAKFYGSKRDVHFSI